MRNLCQVDHEHLIGNGLTQSNRQFHLCLLELSGVEDTLHAHNVRLGVRHLDTYGSLARDRSNDTYSQGCKTQGDVVLEILDFRDAHTFGRLYLIECDGRTHRSSYGTYGNTKVAQHLDDAVFVGYLFCLVDIVAIVLIFLEQAQGGVLVLGERLLGVDGRIEMLHIAYHCSVCLFVGGSYGYIHIDISSSYNVGVLCLLFSLLGTKLTLFLQQRLFFYRVFGLRVLVFLEAFFRVHVEVDHLCRFWVFELLKHGAWQVFVFLLYRFGLIVLSLVGNRFLFIFFVIGDFERHPLGYESNRVESLSDDRNGLGSKIGEECHGNDEQDGCESRRSHDVLEPLYDE